LHRLNDADYVIGNEYLTGANLTGTNLNIIDGGGTQTIDLAGLQDGTGTDDQNLTGATLTGTSLQIDIEGGTSTTVNLASLQDGTGTDNQNISGSGLSGTSLTIGIEDGTNETVSLASLVNDADYVIGNEYLTGGNLTGTNLNIIDGGGTTSIDLSSLSNSGTDNQNISGSGLSGTTLTIGIEDGTNETVDLASLEDDEDWTKTGTHMYSAVSGNVGIGTTSPGNKLEVRGNIAVAVSNTQDVVKLSAPGNDGTLELYTGEATPVLRTKISSYNDTYFNAAGTGNVGIGTTTPVATLNVGDVTGPTIYLTREDVTTVANDVLGSILFDSTDDTSPSTTDASAGIRAYASLNHGNSNKGGYMTFFTKNNVSNASAATEHMRITANGNVGIGVTNPTVKFQVVGDAAISGKFNSNGIQESSDRRFKKNIIKLGNSLEKVMLLEAVSYNWRVEEFPEKRFGDKKEIGLIAQDLEQVYPELVSTDQDGYKSVQYSHLVPVLIEAIKEQQKQIEGLKKQAENSDSKYGDLKRYLSEIENKDK
jgi:hypothetical protein